MANEEKSDESTNTAAETLAAGIAVLDAIAGLCRYGVCAIAQHTMNTMMKRVEGSAIYRTLSALNTAGAAGVNLYFGYKHFFSNNNQITTTP